MSKQVTKRKRTTTMVAPTGARTVRMIFQEHVEYVVDVVTDMPFEDMDGGAFFDAVEDHFDPCKCGKSCPKCDGWSEDKADAVRVLGRELVDAFEPTAKEMSTALARTDRHAR